jgi:transcriptional regulator with XRE-family HTH domain
MARRSKSLSAQLRAAILSAPVSRYRMAKEAKVSQAVLSRFVKGETGLRMAIADRLAFYLKLELRKVCDK